MSCEAWGKGDRHGEGSGGRPRAGHCRVPVICALMFRKVSSGSSSSQSSSHFSAPSAVATSSVWAWWANSTKSSSSSTHAPLYSASGFGLSAVSTILGGLAQQE
eukprot:EG_transcript_55188